MEIKQLIQNNEQHNRWTTARAESLVFHIINATKCSMFSFCWLFFPPQKVPQTMLGVDCSRQRPHMRVNCKFKQCFKLLSLETVLSWVKFEFKFLFEFREMISKPKMNSKTLFLLSVSFERFFCFSGIVTMRANDWFQFALMAWILSEHLNHFTNGRERWALKRDIPWTLNNRNSFILFFLSRERIHKTADQFGNWEKKPKTQF